MIFTGAAPVSVSATDSAGAVWTLALSATALDQPARITLTPFSSVSAAAGAPHVTSGVKLSPDGLVFTDPPALSVKAPPGRSSPTILTARGDGSGLAYGLATTAGTIILPHFSAAVADWDPLDVQGVRTDYEDALLTARDYLKQPNQKNLPMPQEDLAPCPNKQQVDSPAQLEDAALEQAYLEPEATMVRRLMGDAHTLSVSGSNVGTEATDVAYQLVRRIEDRALADLKSKESQPDHGARYLAPTARALLGSEKSLQLLGAVEDSAVTAELAGWVRRLAEDQLTLLKQHDYDAFRRGLALIRQWELLGGTSDDVLGQLLALLSFKTTIGFSITGSASETAQIDGTITSDSGGSLKAEGAGAFSGGSVPVPGLGSASKATPDGWSTTLTATAPDVCSGQIGLKAAPWGKDRESWQAAGFTVPVRVGGYSGLIQACVDQALGEAMQENDVFEGWDGLYFQLHNKSAQAVDDTKSVTCSGSAATFQMQLHVQMTHVV